jgi:glycosyltransferase involved in cell wall biosynthesis
MKPVVSVCMITYNHEKYISEAINGILMQKTNFDIELIISEDCSTDKTREIAQRYALKYPDIIVLDLPTTNRGMSENFRTCLSKAKGKYIALCEGDDYWIDPLKLQKQVDALEQHQEMSICSHRYFEQYENQMTERNYPYILKKRKLKSLLFTGSKAYQFTREDNLKSWFTQPLTTVFRSELVNNMKYTKCDLFRDVFLFYYILSHGDGVFLDFNGGVYRKHNGGAYSGLQKSKRLELTAHVYGELYATNRADIILLKKSLIADIMYGINTSFSYYTSSIIRLFHAELSMASKLHLLLKVHASYFKHYILSKNSMK